MNRAGTARLPTRHGIGRLQIGGNRDRKQCRRVRSCFRQLAALEKTTPLEYLVRIYPVRPRNLCHTRTWLHRQLHDRQLLRNRPPLPSAPSDAHIICMNHAAILIYRTAPPVEGNPTRLPWITRIAINSALMLLRKRRSRSEKGFDFCNQQAEASDSWEVLDPAPNPERLCSDKQTRQILIEAVSGLSPHFRSVVVHYHGEELSVIDAANALGITECTSKSRLMRARAVLRRRLKGRFAC